MRALTLTVLTILFLVCFSVVVGGAELKISQNVTKQNLGTFNGLNLPYWSEETRNYFTSDKSKLDIDNFAYVVDYDLFKGYVVIYSSRVEPISFVDVFSGNWKKTTLKKGYNRFNFSSLGEYGGLRILTIGSPSGFALLKQKRDIFAFENYPIVILRKELANFSWQRALTALGYFVFGLSLSYYLRRFKLLINVYDNLFIVVLISALILICLSLDFSSVDVKQIVNNQTIIKTVESLSLSKEKLKDMYNWAFVVIFMLGFVFATFLTSYEKLYLAIVDYSTPIRILSLPYLSKQQLIRDLDGKLTKIKFKNEIKQFANFELNKETVKGILAINVTDNILEKTKADYSVKPALIAFIATMSFILLADYLNVYKIDFKLSFVIALVVALIFNAEAFINRFRLKVEKEKVIECSELVNEENFKRMLKNAEIKQFAEDYNKLLRAYVKEKITQPRKVISELLGVIRELKEVESDEQT
ncbi:hypothetical protein [Archaeoglobus sp. JdFR-39]|jgi:hypothetical protein|uniref:hypothetical protein n=1 Tax=Archaeoglobus sp. JdFR-39 TaxID=1934996 RepID=UPI0025B947A2|nr:hypothetical protein [Archaeoglobus sp. JdFR-39]